MLDIQKAINQTNYALDMAKQQEAKTGDTMDSLERAYYEGYLEALIFIKAVNA
jgi:hypothetical protein